MEEIVQALMEEGVLTRDPVGTRHAVPLSTDIHIPPTVQAVLASRIDRLSPDEKELLQTLAVVGKEFSLGLLKQVADQSEETLLRLLSRLQVSEFIYEQPAFPEPEYVFKHALTQEVAYNSLLMERRKGLHERTAKAIESIFHSRLEDHYEALAHHYTRSGNAQKAVDYLQLAGQQAAQRSPYAEAITHLTTALELLKTRPDTFDRAQQELALQLALGAPLMTTRGYAIPEVEQIYNRARELCQHIGETPQLFTVLRGLWVFYLVKGEFHVAHELGRQLLHLAQNAHEQSLLLEGHFTLGDTLVTSGEYVPAREHLEQALSLYDSRLHHSHTFLYGQDPGVFSLALLGWALWFLGYPDRALKRTEEAVALAQELDSPFNLALALNFNAILHNIRREERETQERATATIRLSTEQGFPFWLAWGRILQGWALTQQEHEEDGLAEMRQGWTSWQAIRAEILGPYFHALLAEGWGKTGKTEEALAALAEALAIANKTGERQYEPELHRLKGELTLQRLSVVSPQLSVPSPRPLTPDPQAEAEACFLKAIEISQRQQAKSLELRATMSLARLWQQQGKRDEARQILADIYGWFTEGFDTLDLKEAKALLAGLGSKALKRQRRELKIPKAPRKSSVKRDNE